MHSENHDSKPKIPLHTRQAVREFSRELRQAQADLRILRGVRWDVDFEQAFLSQEHRPTKKSVRFSYVEKRKHFHLEKKLHELYQLHRRMERMFSKELPDVVLIFDSIIGDFRQVAHLLATLGTEDFGNYSAQLYGAPNLSLSKQGPTILEIAEKFGRSLYRVSDEETEKMYPKILNSEGLASLLRHRLQESHLIESVKVVVTDQLIADAAAGADYVKVRSSAKFSVKDVDVLLYHEIFTHIVTGLNGRNQKFAKWLGFDSPRCASTQEGLAVFLEMLSGKTYPRRLKRVVDRVILLGKIEAGETPGQMYDWLREMNYSHSESLNLIMRAFRGCDPDSRKPFTKDVSYLKGLVECFNFIHINLIEGHYDRIHALYAGKMNLREVPALTNLIELGVVEKPRWIPPDLLDLDSLAGWFAYVIALGGLGDHELQNEFKFQKPPHLHPHPKVAPESHPPTHAPSHKHAPAHVQAKSTSKSSH